MAVKASSVATSKLVDQLTCAVCLDQYTDPRTLPCLHSFCVECLGGLPLDRKQDGTYTCACPTCRKVIDLPQQGMIAFPKSFHLKNLIELQQELAKAELTIRETCESCEKNEATAGYCIECDKVLCTSCDDIHKKWGPTSTHKLVNIEERSKVKKPKPTPVLNCLQHTKPLDLYCVTCEQLICSHCTIKGHKGHTHDLISDVYEEEKKQVTEKMEKLTEKIAKIKTIREELKANQLKIRDEVNLYKNLMQVVEERFVEAIQNVVKISVQQFQTSMDSKLKFEEQQVNSVDVWLNDLTRLKEHAQRCVDVETPIQLLSMKAQLMARMEDFVKSSAECELTEPLEKPLLGDEFNKMEKDLSELDIDMFMSMCSDFVMTNHSKEFYQQCKFSSISLPVSAYNSEIFKGKFQVLFEDHPIMIKTDDIVCSFVNDYGDDVICEVDHCFKNAQQGYEIKFIPTIPGAYMFTLQFDGVEIDTQTVVIVEEKK